MPLETVVKRRNQLQVSQWSGGTTTQLAIYPGDAIYSERNFKWRLSSAKVETEQSVFTMLPGIERIIMILNGQIVLEHAGHHKVTLKPYEQDHFSGSWETKSFGKVTDFNLMMSIGCEGELEAIFLKNNEHKTITFDNEKKYLKNTQALYCAEGKIYADISGNNIILGEGDILLVTSDSSRENLKFSVFNKDIGQAVLIKADILY